MKTKEAFWILAFICLLLSCSTAPSDYQFQADDWSVSWLLEDTLKQYVKPYTGSLVDTVTSSGFWKMFGEAVNGIQGVINYSSEYLYTYYEDHLKSQTQKSKEWMKEKFSPFMETIQDIVKKVW